MSAHPTQSVNESVRRIKHGDREAFADFYDLLAPRVFGVVKRVLRDPSMSEEVTQEIFVELWRTVDRFDETQASATTWALTIARRRAIDRVRSEQSQRNRVEDLGNQPSAPVAEPGDDVISSMEGRRVQRAVADLPEEQREVIMLSFMEGHAHGEIADMLDLPLGTVKGRARSGLQKLRGRLGGSS